MQGLPLLLDCLCAAATEALSVSKQEGGAAYSSSSKENRSLEGKKRKVQRTGLLLGGGKGSERVSVQAAKSSEQQKVELQSQKKQERAEKAMRILGSALVELDLSLHAFRPARAMLRRIAADIEHQRSLL
jgi:hypothetical protein